jgi:ubiquinone/menaquinone biosynthesis C-methylase UbiE
MLAVAAGRASMEGLTNLEFHESDAETLRFPDETFDAVTCVCTFMFCPDPVRAAREIRRVLRTDGRFGIVVWDHPSLNRFSMLMLDVISKFITLPALPDAKAPGPFRFSEPGELESVLRAAGFDNFTVESQTMTFEFGSVAEYLDVVSEVTGWKRRIVTLPDPELSRLGLALKEAVEPHLDGGRVHLQATVRCAFGSK